MGLSTKACHAFPTAYAVGYNLPLLAELFQITRQGCRKFLPDPYPLPPSAYLNETTAFDLISSLTARRSQLLPHGARTVGFDGGIWRPIWVASDASPLGLLTAPSLRRMFTPLHGWTGCVPERFVESRFGKPKSSDAPTLAPIGIENY